MKCYCAYAYRKDNPKDILGLIQDESGHFFKYSKNRVFMAKAYQNIIFKNKILKYHNIKPLRKKIEDQYKRLKGIFNDKCSPACKMYSKNRIKEYLTDVKDVNYLVYSQCSNQFTYRYLKSKIQAFPPPQGYVAVVVRAYSKNCAINFDVKQKNELIQKKDFKNSYKIRNVPFSVK